MRTFFALLLPLHAVILLTACATSPEDRAAIERGRYLVRISGCNDCHTEEFMNMGGDVPEEEWLTGSRRGWRNEQGTTYATNLRLLISRIDENQWVALAQTMRTRAPMAWYRLREIKESDLRAIYRDTYAALQPRYGGWVIFDHCMPFDVTRAYDEATAHPDPRIWTAARDPEMWQAPAG